MSDSNVRAAFYYDGFNMYHSVSDLGKPHLKWLNLYKLSQALIDKTESLVKVVFCSAFYPGDEKKKFRHTQFMNALRISSVDCIMGHYIKEPKECLSCGAQWRQPNEKASDINLSLSLITDAYADVFDVAYLVTADSDQVATVQHLKRIFPAKRVVTVAPPGRPVSVHLKDEAHGAIKINSDFLDYCLFEGTVLDPSGTRHGRRPREYEPPENWVHPSARKAKPPSARF